MNEEAFRGEILRERRQELQLSVDDVYRKLRIPTDCVEAFESGLVQSLPVDTYAAGFLRTYCEFLQLDPEPWLDGLRESRLALAREAKSGHVARLSDRPKWVREAITWAAVSAILALGWFAYTVVVQPADEGAETTVQAETLDVQDSPELPSLR